MSSTGHNQDINKVTPPRKGTPKTPVIHDFKADFETTKKAFEDFNPKDAFVITDGVDRLGIYVEDFNVKKALDEITAMKKDGERNTASNTKNFEDLNKKIESLNKEIEVLKKDRDHHANEIKTMKDNIKTLRKSIATGFEKIHSSIKESFDFMKRKTEEAFAQKVKNTGAPRSTVDHKLEVKDQIQEITGEKELDLNMTAKGVEAELLSASVMKEVEAELIPANDPQEVESLPRESPTTENGTCTIM